MTNAPTLRLCCALATILLAEVAARAEPEIARPAAAKRVVRLFEFDAPEKYALPRYWDMAQDGAAAARPGFPRYNGAEHDMTVACRGAGSVRLFTRGGSTCLRLDPGVVPVFPRTEYVVSARVRTRGLLNGRAAITARYMDRANTPIAGTDIRSELVVSAPGVAGAAESGGAEWRVVSCSLPGNRDDAAYIQIDLEILQAEQFQASQLAQHQVWPNDFPADAWFDDVAVVQLPRVLLATNDPGNIIQQPRRPEISLSLRDLTGESLDGRLTLQDASGTILDQADRPLEGGNAQWTWRPSISALGWYRATLDLTSGGKRVGGTCVDFLWVPPVEADPARAHSPDRQRFSIILDHLPDTGRDVFPGLVARLGTAGVAFPVWSPGQTQESVSEVSRDLLPLIARLKEEWQQVTFILPRLPAEIAAAAGLEADQTLAALAMDQKLWAPHLLPLLDRYGQMVQRWQVGMVGDPPPRAADPAAALSAFQSALAKLVPGPAVTLPWPAELPPKGLAGTELVVHVPYTAPPDAIRGIGEAWLGSPASPSGPRSITFVLEPLPESQYSRRESASRLIKQAVEAWGVTGSRADGGVHGGIALSHPWDWPATGRGQIMPRPEAGALANVASRLADRRIVGRLPVADGVVCSILAPVSSIRGDAGALVAWNAGAPAERAVLEACLGDGPVTVVDIWGNATPIVPSSQGGRGGMYRIPLTDEPVFIENVDVELARFIASFRLEPDFAPCTAAEHELVMVLSNPFSTRADGRLTILEPGGLSAGQPARDRSWRITPRVSAFSIAPGQETRIPLTVAFSAAEESGEKPFIAEVELSADRDYGAIRIRAGFEVRLDAVQLELTYRIPPGTQDLVVEAHATNKGKTPATLQLSAHAPGFPRSRASISELVPGETATRRFAYPGGLPKLRGQRVVVGVQDAESQARVNRSLGID